MQLEIAQLQPDLYDLPLTAEIELANGHRIRRSVHLTDAVHAFTWRVHASPINVRIDPDHHLLHWRPEYGPPPGPNAVSYIGRSTCDSGCSSESKRSLATRIAPTSSTISPLVTITGQAPIRTP